MELSKVAILFEEEWYDAITEAVGYYTQKNYDAVCTILLKMHAKMNHAPTSQNEICFFQKYEADYQTAETFLRLYSQRKEE